MRSFLIKTSTPNGLMMGALAGGFALVALGQLTGANPAPEAVAAGAEEGAPKTVAIVAGAAEAGAAAPQTLEILVGTADASSAPAEAAAGDAPHPTDGEAAAPQTVKIVVEATAAPVATRADGTPTPAVAVEAAPTPQPAVAVIATPPLERAARDAAEPEIAEPVAVATEPAPAPRRPARAAAAEPQDERSGLLGRAQRLADRMDNRLQSIFK